MPSSHPVPPSCHGFPRLASALDPRSAPRLAWLLVGAVLARGRRTVTSWVRAAGLSHEYRPCYTAVAAAGRRTDLAAARLAHDVIKPLVAGHDRLTFALDDTPTERYGRHVQGAGVHHNPTPGPAGGAIRVVLVDEPGGWVAFFCSDPAAGVADILGHVAARFALETTFRDVKEVIGAGQQQVRSVAGNVGSFHLCAWAFTMTEAWAWGRAADDLVGHRSASPWDDEARRPSHADKRRAWRRELLGDEIRAVLRPGLTEAEIRAAEERLLNLAA